MKRGRSGFAPYIYFRAFALFAAIIVLAACGHNADRAKRTALQKGRQLYGKGDFGNAAIEFHKALQEDPRFGEGYYWLGRTENRRGHYAEALDGLKRAVALLPSEDAPKIELANILLVGYLGSSSRPAPLYQQITRISQELGAGGKSPFDDNRLKGYLAMVDAQPAKAVQYFENANRVKPNEPDVATALAESLMLDGQKERAEQTARDFLRVMPSYGPLYTFLYQYYMQNKRAAAAEEILKGKIAHNPAESLYRIELARHYLQTGRKREMAEVLDQLAAAKDLPHGNLDAGDFYVGIGDGVDARRHYEQGERSNPADKLTCMKRLVRLAVANNDRAGARQLLDRILGEQPRDAEAVSTRAALRMAAGDPGEKKTALDELGRLARETDQTQYKLEYAEALRNTGAVDLAQLQYQAVLKKEPGNISALQAMAELSIRQERAEEALRYAERALAQDPASVRARLVRSAALAFQGRYMETRLVLNGLAHDRPDLREAQLQLALLDTAEKRYPQAEERFRKYYVPGSGDVRSLEGLVELYRAQDQMGKAIALLKRDLEKEPEKEPRSLAVRALLAKTAAQAGHEELAVTEYEIVARAQPDSPVIAMELGLSYQAQGNAAGAVRELERASQLAPRNALVPAYLGKALDEAGRKADAIASYRRSLAIDNRNPWVMNNTAYLLAEAGGNLNEALQLASGAARLQPESAAFRDTLGWIYYKKRDLPNAVRVLESVRDKSPKEVGVRIHLSQALLAMGDRTRCRGELHSALALASTPEERNTIDRLLAEVRQD